ncbi:MAG: septal ring lytic transglycosylase RlpA family lipoprotein, partial [Venatoribacter sp.]
MRIVFLIGFSLVLTACSLTPSRYAHKQDFTPEAKDISTLAEPIPKEEPRSVLGNPASYKVLGKEYHVLKTAEG